MHLRKTQGRRAGTKVISLFDSYCLSLPADTAGGLSREGTTLINEPAKVATGSCHIK